MSWGPTVLKFVFQFGLVSLKSAFCQNCDTFRNFVPQIKLSADTDTAVFYQYSIVSHFSFVKKLFLKQKRHFPHRDKVLSGTNCTTCVESSPPTPPLSSRWILQQFVFFLQQRLEIMLTEVLISCMIWLWQLFCSAAHDVLETRLTRSLQN